MIGVAFAAPETVVVRKGDTLSKLGKRFGVEAGDISAWNGLTTTTLEVGQELFVWRAAPTSPPAVTVAAKPPPRRGIVQRLVGGGTATDAAPAPAADVLQVEEIVLAAVDDGPTEGARRRVSIQTSGVRGSGLLGVDMGGSNIDDLARTAAGMQQHDSDAGRVSLEGRGRGLSAGGTADTLTMPTREARQVGPQIPDRAVSPPRLARPAAKRCLAGPSGISGDRGVSTNVGLTVQQVNAGMGRVSRQAVRCFPSGTRGAYTVVVEVRVGCDGRVANVYTISAGAVPARVTSCIEKTLGYGSFAAHAVPDGVSFQSPLKFSF